MTQATSHACTLNALANFDGITSDFLSFTPAPVTMDSIGIECAYLAPDSLVGLPIRHQMPAPLPDDKSTWKKSTKSTSSTTFATKFPLDMPIRHKIPVPTFQTESVTDKDILSVSVIPPVNEPVGRREKRSLSSKSGTKRSKTGTKRSKHSDTDDVATTFMKVSISCFHLTNPLLEIAPIKERDYDVEEINKMIASVIPKGGNFEGCKKIEFCDFERFGWNSMLHICNDLLPNWSHPHKDRIAYAFLLDHPTYFQNQYLINVFINRNRK